MNGDTGNTLAVVEEHDNSTLRPSTPSEAIASSETLQIQPLGDVDSSPKCPGSPSCPPRLPSRQPSREGDLMIESPPSSPRLVPQAATGSFEERAVSLDQGPQDLVVQISPVDDWRIKTGCTFPAWPPLKGEEGTIRDGSIPDVMEGLPRHIARTSECNRGIIGRTSPPRSRHNRRKTTGDIAMLLQMSDLVNDGEDARFMASCPEQLCTASSNRATSSTSRSQRISPDASPSFSAQRNNPVQSVSREGKDEVYQVHQDQAGIPIQFSSPSKVHQDLDTPVPRPARNRHKRSQSDNLGAAQLAADFVPSFTRWSSQGRALIPLTRKESSITLDCSSSISTDEELAGHERWMQEHVEDTSYETDFKPPVSSVVIERLLYQNSECKTCTTTTMDNTEPSFVPEACNPAAVVMSSSTIKPWMCTCGQDNDLEFQFCGMCGTSRNWICSLCDFDKNKVGLPHCGGCGVRRVA